MPVDVKLLKPEDAKVLLSTKPLGDPAVGPALVDAVVAADQSFAGKAITVSLGGTLSIRAFNSEDDEDEDGVLGEPADEAPGGGLAPQLRLTPNDAFVKYRCAATVKATAAGTALGSLGFDFEGSAELVLADYQRHPRTADTRTAVFEGLTALRSSLRLADVLDELRPNEAVSQQLVGRLSAGVEVSWADMFSGPIGPVARLAGTAAPLLINVSAGATLSARVSLTDDFILVISRESDDRWRVGVRKARTRDAALGPRPRASRCSSIRSNWRRFSARSSTRVLGERLARVEALVTSGGALERLPDAQQKLARALLDRFGLSSTPTPRGTARSRGRDQGAASRRLSPRWRRRSSAMGFAYEYRRVRQDTTIAQCVLTRAGLTAHHPELVRGNIAPTLADAAAGVNGASLERYLNEKTLRTERSWGFSLSIGKWQAGSRDTKTITRVERTSAAGLRQHSFVGVRAYIGDGGAQAEVERRLRCRYARLLEVAVRTPDVRVPVRAVVRLVRRHEEAEGGDARRVARPGGALGRVYRERAAAAQGGARRWPQEEVLDGGAADAATRGVQHRARARRGRRAEGARRIARGRHAVDGPGRPAIGRAAAQAVRTPVGFLSRRPRSRAPARPRLLAGGAAAPRVPGVRAAGEPRTVVPDHADAQRRPA